MTRTGVLLAVGLVLAGTRQSPARTPHGEALRSKQVGPPRALTVLPRVLLFSLGSVSTPRGEVHDASI